MVALVTGNGKAEKSRDGMFASLRTRDFRVLMLWGLPGIIGSSAQFTAILWTVKELTKSNTRVGLINTAGTLPVFFLVLLAGALTDRMDRKKLIASCQLVIAGAAVGLGLMYSYNYESFALLVVLVFVNGCASALSNPAWRVLYVDLMRDGPLLNAMAVSQAQSQLSRILGPLLAILFFAIHRSSYIFYFNAISCVATILVLYSLKANTRPGKRAVRRVRKEIMEGLRYVRKRRWVLLLLAIFGLNAFFGLSSAVLFPSLAQDVLKAGPEAYGFLVMLLGIGGVLVVSVITRMRRKMRELRIVKVSFLLVGVFLILLSLVEDMWEASLAIVALGSAIAATQVSITTIIQANIPPDMRGRIAALMSMLAAGMLSVGGILAGGAADGKSTAATFLLAGICCVVLAAVSFAIPFKMEEAPRDGMPSGRPG